MANEQFLDPTPVQRPLFSLLARGLGGVIDYSNQKDPSMPGGLANPVLPHLVEALGLAPAKDLLEKLAYGERLTKGKGQTLSLAENVGEGALALSPLASGLAKGAYKVAGKFPSTPKGQLNALYSGGNPDLYLSHKTRDLLKTNDDGSQSLVSELYNPSFAVNRKSLSNFDLNDADSGPLWLVPREGRLDPKLEKTILTATDSYSPRYTSGAGKRVDNISSYDKRRLESLANARLADKLGTGFPRGGINQEDAMSSLQELPKYGEGSKYFRGLAKYSGGLEAPPDMGATFFARMYSSPRFQSFKHYENSPVGAATLGETAGHNELNAINTAWHDTLSRLGWEDSPGSFTGPPLAQSPGIGARQLASGVFDPLVRYGDKGPSVYQNLRKLSNPYNYSSGQPLSDEEIAALQKFAGDLLGRMKRAPVNYSEVKKYGAFPINQDTTAGIVMDYTYPSKDALMKAATARGLPTEFAKDRFEAAKIADELQKWRKRSIVDVLPRKAQPESDIPKSKPVGGNLVPHGMFDWDTPDFASMPIPELKAMDTSKLSNADFKLWDKTLEEKLSSASAAAAHAAKIQKPKEDHPQFPGISNWVVDNFHSKGLANGDFDYLPTPDIEKLGVYAMMNGHNDLYKAVLNYADKADSVITKEHDIALEHLLKEWELVKNFNLGLAGGK